MEGSLYDVTKNKTLGTIQRQKIMWNIQLFSLWEISLSFFFLTSQAQSFPNVKLQIFQITI